MPTEEDTDPGQSLASRVAESNRIARRIERRMRQRTWWFVAVIAAVLLAGIGVGWALLGQNARIDSRVAANNASIHALIARVEREARADCSFKLDWVVTPAEAVRATGRPPAPFLVRIALHARSTFIDKGCPETVDPDTGKPFGQPPAVRTK